MEAISMRAFPFSPALIGSEKPKIERSLLLNFGRIYGKNCIRKLGNSDRISLGWSQPSVLTLSKAYGDFSGSIVTGFDIDQDLKDKANEVSKLLNGRVLYLVGLMGAGKTTLGKVLAELLGFTFVDSDKYVEQSLGGKFITDIFEQHGESFFRYFEGEALRKLSSIPEQVVSTGGGAVLHRANWKYMKQGVSIFLDVPLYTLALRIAKDGPSSRPLVQDGSGNALTRAFRNLLILHERRKAAYSNADATVSLLGAAKKLGLADVSDISTTAMTMEVLITIESFLQGQHNRSPPFHTFPGH
ncbi:hypothetical protein Pfo_016647 [Paulownia fortunei]|nr:hypothetical protein Pfo_016647 [Paulownia fortunei]